MKNIKYILVIATAIVLTSCSVSGPLLVTDNPSGPKRGEATYKVILGFPPINGDRSIKKAAENGGITKIATVDYRVYGGLFVKKHTTIVTGE
ncbi:MAG: protein trl (tRNA-associated locus protein) [Marinilabiliales bacterium]|nr:MAG: protein trl (tRNA-associated locus protein) [Marinilabiliales bacterium]